MEMESRTPKGRGKRRGAANTPVNDTRTLRKGRRGSNIQTFTAPPSPAKSESNVGLKRKGRPTDIDLSAAEQRSSKRSRSGSQVPTPNSVTPNSETPPTDAQGFIECPEPNCSKKYRNANGLKYHQSHAHSGNNDVSNGEKEDMDYEDVPLSVVKNSAKKEKESKKEKKDKDNKQDKSENAKKSKEDSSDKLDTKCDTNSSSSASKKKEKDNGSKTTVAQANPNNAISGKVQTNVSKSGISGNNTGNSNLVTSGSSQNAPVQTVTSQVSTSASLLTTTSSSSSLPVSTVPSVMQSITQGESVKIGDSKLGDSSNAMNTGTTKLVDIKPKVSDIGQQRVSKPNRPIVPAPGPTHAVLSNVQVTHSNLSPVMTHAQMSPQLKPIQPKPTIMGEPQNINPALADLNKDRKKVQKKKSKDLASGNNQANQAKVDQPTIKVERSGVIKTNPMPTSKLPAEQQKNVMNKDTNRSDNQRSQLVPLAAKGSENMQHPNRNAQNPNLLKVGSPLQVNTPEKGPVSDDVQSPAYSDISDANESASPAGPSDSSPQKQKEEKKKEKSEAQQLSQNENQPVPNYGMYYFGQSPYSMNSMSSPGQKVPGQQGSNQSNCNPPTPKPSQDNRGTPTQNRDKPMGPDEPKVKKESEPVDTNRPKGPPGMPQHMQGPPPPAGMSPQEYQMMYHQQMYHLQSIPQHMQYQYMANGWYPQSIDPNYMRQLMEHREGPPGLPKGPGEADRGAVAMFGARKDDGPSKSVISPGGQSTGSNDGRKSDDKGVTKDQALRDKQNENHQILKENIELKNEMDKNKYFRPADEIRRQRMYQEQRKMEMARKGETRLENLTKAPGTKPILDHSARNLSGQMSSGESKDKRDSHNGDKNKDNRESHSRDSSLGKYSDGGRSNEDKNKGSSSSSDKHRAETPTRNPETPKSSRPGGSSSKSGSPLNSATIASSPSYPPYLPGYPHYIQSPHFMPMDPSHPMYRNPSVNPALISTPFSASPYIHPSQMGYRPPSESDEKDKLIKPPTSEPDPKKGTDANAPYYGNMHKIHELSEKGRPKSRNSSPVLGKSSSESNSGNYDKHRDYTNSPPTQRHVHTHHHTHVLGPGLQPPAPLQGPPFYPVNDPYTGEYRRM